LILLPRKEGPVSTRKAAPKFTRGSVSARLSNLGLSGFSTEWLAEDDGYPAIVVSFKGSYPVAMRTESEQTLARQGYEVETVSQTSFWVTGLSMVPSGESAISAPETSDDFSLETPIVHDVDGVALADWERELLAKQAEVFDRDASTIQEAMGAEPTEHPLPEIKPLSPVRTNEAKPRRTWYGKKIKEQTTPAPEPETPLRYTPTFPEYPTIFQVLAKVHGHEGSDASCSECHTNMTTIVSSLYPNPN
jgi:hypothetical protein